MEKTIKERIKKVNENPATSFICTGLHYDEHVNTAQRLLGEYSEETISDYMCDEIREELHSHFDDFECFLVAYCERHAQKYGQDFYYAF